MRSLLAATATAAALAFVSPLAQGYEEDVHYGLTYWLALRAGFVEAQAERIAAANVEYDHSGLSATKLVAYYVCLGTDRNMSQLVKQIHFPSDGPVPGDPPDRKVDAGSAEAYRAVRSRLALPSTSEAENLLVFGQGLHPLQDSWSHQGIPGSPLGRTCQPRLSWGHPDSRGGWRRHNADLVNLYVQDAVAMARATYVQLCEFRDKFQSSPCKEPFEAFAADIVAFAATNTKQAKADWFKAHGIREVAFLDATNVPDGPRYAGRHEPVNYATSAHLPAAKSKLAALPPTVEARFMREFFQAWATEKDLASLAKLRIALSAYRDVLAQGDRRAVDPSVVETQLAFWRIRDHGSLTPTLAGVHDLIGLPPGQVADVAPSIRRADEPYPDVESALLPFDPSGLPIVTWVWPQPDGRKLLVGAVRFRHAPKDLVIVVADNVDGAMKVVSISSTLME